MERTIFAAAAVFAVGVPTWAQEDDSLAGPELGQPEHYEAMKEAEWDWRPGDMIFRNGINEIDETVKRALGLRWASVGILRASSGGPRVVYAHQERGVYEDMLFHYVEGLSSDDYAVYRLSGVDPGYDPQEQMGSGPLVRLALTIAYGMPYDMQFLMGDGTFYSAELPYEGALNAGVVLGSPIPLRSLLDGPENLDQEFRKVLEAHRFCRYQLTFADCWANDLGGQSIVTTDSLISSGALEQVYP